MLDTNVIVSALVFGGVPAEIVLRVVSGKLVGIASHELVDEAVRVLSQKLGFSESDVGAFRKLMRKSFRIVHPKKRISILRDEPDNRVLEAAIEGRCMFVITGDKELLKTATYRSIAIVTPRQFIERK